MNRSVATRLARGRWAILMLVALLTLLVPMPVGAAGRDTSTDTFVGTATTGFGQPLPVDIDPSDMKVRSDGAIGLGYAYKATGVAQGQLPGSFVYEEHGYLFFMNPADPTTFAGSEFVSAVFSLDPNAPGPARLIADTNPAAYSNGVRTGEPSAVKGAMGALQKATGGKMAPRGGGPLTYGYFTFTNEHGTFTGYATPDFRQFSIKITFDR